MTRAPRGLLDTNTLILLGSLQPDDLPVEPKICTVTLAELAVGPLVATDEPERAIRQAHLQYAEAQFEPLPFDTPAARSFGLVAAALRGAGRKVKARTFDALIAAVALSRALPLYTVNPSDFVGIASLDLRPIPHPGSSD